MEFFMNKLTQTLAVVLLTILPVLSQIPTKGLVAWFPFTGNFADESGNGIVLTQVMALPTLTADHNGIANAAYSFDGSKSGFKYPTSAKFPLGNSDLTISAWVYMLNGGIPRAFTSWGTDTTGQKKEIVFYQATINDVICLGVTNGVDSVTTEFPGNPGGKWLHVAVSVKSGNAKLYINGILGVSKAITFNIQNGTLGGAAFGIGTDMTNAYYGDNYFGGSLDDISIYNRALTDQEILYVKNCKSTKNSAPTFTSVPSATANIAVQYNYNIITTDIENQAVTIALKANPSGMTLVNGKISWTPEKSQVGKNSITIVAKDVTGDSTIQSFEVTVTPSTSVIQKVINPRLSNKSTSTLFYLPNGQACVNKNFSGLRLINNMKQLIVR
jgi:hypothetical protein